MTAVELVSNPDVHISTHEWVAIGVNNLTRQNKLSSLPFWVPNDKTRHHQLRLVLLRGLEPARTASEDAIGLIIELIAPPAGADVERYPGGCSVTVSVRNEANEEIVPRATEVGQLDEGNSQMCMPQLISAAALRAQRPAHASGSAATAGGTTADAGDGQGEAWLRVKLQLTITTGVNVIAEQVMRSVSAWWSTVSSSVSQLATRTSEVYQQHREEIDALLAVGGTATATTGASSTMTRLEAAAKAPPPWQVIPSAWQSRAEQWRRLVARELVEDDGTFLYGPERVLTPDARALLLQTGMMHKTILEAQHDFSPERDISENLLSNEALRWRHYHLVPRRITDATFWANYFWKVACVARCVDQAQVQAVLTVFNAPSAPHEIAHATGERAARDDGGAAGPPRDASRDTAAEGGDHAALSDAAAMTVLHDAQEAAGLLLEYLSEWDGAKDRLLVEAAVRTCDEHAKQLDWMGRQTGLSSATLLRQQAVAQQLCSCLARYHELRRRAGATQAPAAGAAKSEPTEMPCVVASTSSAAGLREGGDSGDRPPDTAGSAEATEKAARGADLCEGGEAGKAEAVPPAEPPSTATAGALPLSEDEVQFPKMPWEEE